MGSPVRKLTPEEKKLFANIAKEYHERFKTVVVTARKNVQRDAEFFDGLRGSSEGPDSKWVVFVQLEKVRDVVEQLRQGGIDHSWPVA